MLRTVIVHLIFDELRLKAIVNAQISLLNHKGARSLARVNLKNLVRLSITGCHRHR